MTGTNKIAVIHSMFITIMFVATDISADIQDFCFIAVGKHICIITTRCTIVN